MIRPTWASVYSENPAYTSAKRAKSLFSSSLQRLPRPDVVRSASRRLARERVDVGERRALGQDPALDHPGQHPLAVGLVAVVELPLVLGDVLLRRVVRRVVGTRAEPQVPGLLRRRGLAVRDVGDRLVGQVLREVVALLREVRLVDVVVVLGERRVPVVGLAADEAVVAVEPAGERPVAAGGAHRPLVERHVVVLADPVGVVAVLAEHLADGRVLHRDVTGVAREALGPLGDLGEAVLVVVASGEQARPGRRAQRGGVPLRVGEAVVGELLHGRHVDPPAVRRPGGQAGVVVQHDQHVGRALGGRRLPERRPVGDRVPHVDVDHTVELLRHSRSSSQRDTDPASDARSRGGVTRYR